MSQRGAGAGSMPAEGTNKGRPTPQKSARPAAAEIPRPSSTPCLVLSCLLTLYTAVMGFEILLDPPPPRGPVRGGRIVCRGYVLVMSGILSDRMSGLCRYFSGTMPGVRRDYVGIASGLCRGYVELYKAGLCRGYVGFRPPLRRVRVQAKEA